MTVDYLDEVNGRFNVGISCVVRVTVKDGAFRENIGYGSMISARQKGEAFEKAKKEAVTDAMKRCLKDFGNALGNCIYDKEYLKHLSKCPSTSKMDLDQSKIIRPGVEWESYRETSPNIKDSIIDVEEVDFTVAHNNAIAAAPAPAKPTEKMVSGQQTSASRPTAVSTGRTGTGPNQMNQNNAPSVYYQAVSPNENQRLNQTIPKNPMIPKQQPTLRSGNNGSLQAMPAQQSVQESIIKSDHVVRQTVVAAKNRQEHHGPLKSDIPFDGIVTILPIISPLTTLI